MNSYISLRNTTTLYGYLTRTRIFPLVDYTNSTQRTHTSCDSVTVRFHSSSTHAEEEARDEKQDDGEEEDVFPDEASGGLIQWDRVELSSSSILATNYHPQMRLIGKFYSPCIFLIVLPLTLLRFPFHFFRFGLDNLGRCVQS